VASSRQRWKTGWTIFGKAIALSILLRTYQELEVVLGKDHISFVTGKVDSSWRYAIFQCDF
jgi:hypothetical protein